MIGDEGDDTPAGSIAADGTVRTDRKVLELLVCPVTRTTLSYDPIRQELVSRAAHLAFPIRDGVPLMTIDSARLIED